MVMIENWKAAATARRDIKESALPMFYHRTRV
jgi:hypothetical protein